MWEVVFHGFQVEEDFSVVCGGHWSLIVRVVDEEWALMTLPCEEDLPECVMRLGFGDDDDLI